MITTKGNGQEQQTRTEQFTKQQSLVLLKNMIRISVSSICYQRGVFESDCFKCKPYDGLPIHQLDSASKDEDGNIHVHNGEAFQLTQWLERGVFQALEKEYLHGLTFALCSRHPVTGEDILLEKYDFKVTYIGDDHRAAINGASLDSKQELKGQAKKFLRSLIAFVETLDDLPQDRWITMMLKYCDDTPDDFEPEYFRSCEQNALTFGGVPIKVKLGGLATQHMGMNITYSGLESLIYEDLCKVVSAPLDLVLSQDAVDDGMSYDSGIFQGSKEGTKLSKKQAKDTDGEDTLTSKMNAALVLNAAPVLSKNDEAARRREDLNKVIDYVLAQGKANVKECQTALSVNEKTVQAAFKEMMTDGQIKRRGSGYAVEKKARQTSSATSAVENDTIDSSPFQTEPNEDARSKSKEPPSAPRKRRPSNEAVQQFSAPRTANIKVVAASVKGTRQDSDDEGTAVDELDEIVEDADDEDTQLPDDYHVKPVGGPSKRDRDTFKKQDLHNQDLYNRMPALDLQQQTRRTATITPANKDPKAPLTTGNLHKRDHEVQRSLSQSSEQSEMSLGGVGRYSIITEPIYQSKSRKLDLHDDASSRAVHRSQ